MLAPSFSLRHMVIMGRHPSGSPRHPLGGYLHAVTVSIRLLDERRFDSTRQVWGANDGQ
ncbi:hypothetical protein JOD57_000818 [Geodermatophilus bullaregiensis]|uniref:hypothetical protein n=1 Tax=Geodermatophilus bullaregiensis TaxID=1564160 RepID=UPI00195B506A|nr:hypothetical protein [Geodermatophilus bullaregiensis]MBM7804981.1 hypothetical protein [Geodermatophilus bullaregiensis]